MFKDIYVFISRHSLRDTIIALTLRQTCNITRLPICKKQNAVSLSYYYTTCSENSPSVFEQEVGVDSWHVLCCRVLFYHLAASLAISTRCRHDYSQLDLLLSHANTMSIRGTTSGFSYRFSPPDVIDTKQAAIEITHKTLVKREDVMKVMDWFLNWCRLVWKYKVQ